MANRINDMASVTGETYTNESIIRIEYPELNPNHTFGKLSANVEDGGKLFYLDNGDTVETVEMKSYNQINALLNG